MKNKILVYIIIIFAVLCGLTHNVYSQSDVTYFYGEILNLQNYTGTEVLLNEVNIDVGNSSVENTIISNNDEIFKSVRVRDGQAVIDLVRIKELEKENGQYESNILSLKKELFIAAIPYLYSKKVASLMEELLHIKTRIVKEYLSITLTPSNPVLHITGLYNVFKNYKKGMYYKNELKFYEEWNDEASEVLFRYDKEVQEICNSLNPIDLTEVVSLPLYYESEKPSDLTKKLKSIQAFKAVKVPLKKLDGNKYIPDFNSRMFIEDYPYGICIFKDIALMENVNTPVIDMLLKFYENLTGKQYFKNDNSYGKDINETGVFSITGIKNTDDLLSFYK